jgi:hypothetical protein
MTAFQPSNVSLNSKRRILMALKYIKKAAGIIEAYVEAQSDDSVLPDWVLTRINQAATSLGSSVTYLKHLKKRQGFQPSEEK